MSDEGGYQAEDGEKPAAPTTGSGVFRVRRELDHLAKLPALAHRLGVRQINSDQHIGLMLTTHEGQRYDVFELVNAVLDRIDAVLGEQGKG